MREPIEARTLWTAMAVRMATEGLAEEMGFPPLLKGACFVASYVLAAMLRKQGVAAAIAHGSYDVQWNEAPDGHACHCWTALPDGRIVDLTATQFGIPELIYVPRKRAEIRKYREDDRGPKATRLWNQECREDRPFLGRLRRSADAILRLAHA